LQPFVLHQHNMRRRMVWQVRGARQVASSFVDPAFLVPLANGGASAYAQNRLDPIHGPNLPWIDRLAAAHALGFERKPLSTVAHKAIAHDLGKLVDMLAAGLVIPEGDRCHFPDARALERQKR
jgi:hypothetical protein